MNEMKKIFLTAALCLVLCAGAQAQIKIGKRTFDTGKLVEAGKNAATAITLSDRDIVELCAQSVALMDRENRIAPDDSPYAQRLKGLTQDIRVEGLNLNFKVYLTDDINAFASGDGSVRVFSGLMDLMEDDELMAVVGHEIGHVVHTDSKDGIKNAYLRAAARSAASSAGGTLAKLSDSQLGDIAEAVAGAQFSQKQETEADEYGVAFCVENGLDPYAMSRSLEKLLKLSEGAQGQSALAQKIFSDHPDNAKRVERTRALADKATGK